MPRRLLRDARIVDDEWHHLAEFAQGGGPAELVAAGAAGVVAVDTAAVNAAAAGAAALILPLERWLADPAAWSDFAGRLGVMLAPAHKVEQIAPHLARFALVAAEFPGPSEGRGYTQGRLLRERHGFVGELRAAGYVRRDQLFFLARCGFNSFELPENELAAAAAAFSTFTAEYQPSNDAGLPVRLRHR